MTRNTRFMRDIIYTRHTRYTSHTTHTLCIGYESHARHTIEKGSLEDTVLWYIGIPSKWKNRVTQCDKKNNFIVSVKIVS